MRGTRDEGRVGVGDPGGDEGAAEPVDGDVVVAVVPDPVLVTEPEQRVPEQRGLFESEGHGEVGLSPGVGGGAGVGRIPEVDDGQLPGGVGLDDLVDAVAVGREAGPQGLGRRDDLAQGGAESVDVDGAVDLGVLAYVVGGSGGGVEALAEPHRPLGGGQAEGAGGYAHVVHRRHVGRRGELRHRAAPAVTTPAS